MKRLAALIMVAAVMFTLFTACGNKVEQASNDTQKSTSQESTAPAQQPVEVLKCKYVLPGQAPQDLDKVMPMINEKLKSVGVELEKQYIPWDAWDQKVNIMLSTGEEFDLLNVMNDWIPISNYVGRGAMTDITDLIEQYGPNIKKYNPDIMMNSAKVNGKMYAIPAFWVEFSRSPEITIRLDLLRENGLEIPKTPEELTAAFETIMKNWKGAQKPYLPMVGANADKFGPAQRTYDSWPFTVVDKMFFVGQDGTVKAWVETEEFKKDCELANTWYKKKLVNPDVLVYKPEQVDAQLESGNWFVHFGTYGNSVDIMKKNFPNITTDDFQMLVFDPDKKSIRPYGTRNMNAVPINSKHPEVGVKFINWLYDNQENYNLYCYGIEGTHYKRVEGQKARIPINDPALKQPTYISDDWMIGNLHYLLPNADQPKSTINALYTLDENAVNSIAAGFVFDSSKVSAELGNVKTELQSSVSPMVCGVVSYEKGYAEALNKLKKAGLDKVVAEFQTQFEAYRKSQGN